MILLLPILIVYHEVISRIMLIIQKNKKYIIYTLLDYTAIILAIISNLFYNNIFVPFGINKFNIDNY